MVCETPSDAERESGGGCEIKGVCQLKLVRMDLTSAGTDLDLCLAQDLRFVGRAPAREKAEARIWGIMGCRWFVNLRPYWEGRFSMDGKS